MAAAQASAVSLGVMGAFVGGVTATAQNTYKVARGEMKSVDAARNVARETVGTGLSTAAGGAATTLLGLSGIVGLAGLLVVASLTKGAWDNALTKEAVPEKKKA